MLNDKMNMNLHLSETTIKTILGTNPKNSIENDTSRNVFSQVILEED